MGAFGMGHESVNSGPRVAAKGAFCRALFILVSAFPESHQCFCAEIVYCQGSWALLLGPWGLLIMHRATVHHVLQRRIFFDPKPKPRVLGSYK